MAKKPRYGPPKLSALPIGWPSPVTMSAPYSPGGVNRPRLIGSAETTNSAPAACTLSASACISAGV